MTMKKKQARHNVFRLKSMITILSSIISVTCKPIDGEHIHDNIIGDQIVATNNNINDAENNEVSKTLKHATTQGIIQQSVNGTCSDESDASSCSTKNSNKLNDDQSKVDIDLNDSNDMENDDDGTSSNNNNHNNRFACRLYLAESTIPNAGLGIFTGVPFLEKEELPLMGDVIIPLSPLARRSLINEYTWSGDIIYHAFALGMGALPNCLFPLNNVDVSGPANNHGIRIGNIIHDDDNNNDDGIAYYIDDYTDPSFSYNPGIGSSTIYYSTDGGNAIRDLRVGEEIFIDYGTDYFTSRADTKFGLIPLHQDYIVADKLLHRFRNVASRVHERIDTCMNEVENDILELRPPSSQGYTSYRDQEEMSPSIDTDENTLAFELYELTKQVITTWPCRVQGALPSEVSGINHMLDVVKSTGWNFLGRSVRDLSYLKKNGVCVDNVKADKSTIPLVGNGAFANTFLPTGSIVVAMPLIHIYDRSVLERYEGEMIDDMLDLAEAMNNSDDEDDDDEDLEKVPKDWKVIHYQLLLNYCFGHNQSSILLCPYGIGSGLVNHAGPGYEANVKLVWSESFTKKKEWFNQTIDEWKRIPYNGLFFEYVAIRDINENEEILFDYGIEWENAFYNEHVNEKYKSSIHYVYHLINTYEENPIELPTYQEKWTKQNLQDAISSISMSDDVIVLSPTVQPTAIHVWCRVLYLRMQHGHSNFSDDVLTYYPCRIIAKEHAITNNDVTEVLYTAEIYIRDHQIQIIDPDDDDDCDTCICSEVSISVAFQLPRDAFVVGNVNSYDQTNPDVASPLVQYLTETWTFRHEIGIPNEIMPEQWKNLV